MRSTFIIYLHSFAAFACRWQIDVANTLWVRRNKNLYYRLSGYNLRLYMDVEGMLVKKSQRIWISMKWIVQTNGITITLNAD